MAKHHAPKVTTELVNRFYQTITARGAGRENALTAVQIAAKLGFTGSKENTDRRVRAVHHACIESGRLICSGDVGYWEPENMDEVQESIGRWRSQGIEMLDKATRVEKLAAAKFAVEPASQSKKNKTQPINQMAFAL